jgi:cysteine-rich repeat protein
LYNNWSGGQPNAGGDEDCTRMKGDGTWEDQKCTDTERYVCEGPPICGSGARGAGEECDDGNTADGDGCSSTCTLEGPAPCGDGLIWLGEECDDGGALGGDGCSSTCEIEPGYTCTGEPSPARPTAQTISSGAAKWALRRPSICSVKNRLL